MKLDRHVRLLGLVLAFLLAQTVSLNAQTLTLQECIEIALKEHPHGLKKGTLEELKKYQLRTANHTYLPQIGLDGKASYQSHVMNIPLEIPGMDLSMPKIPKDQYDFYIQASQLIWDGGRVAAAKKSIIANTEVAMKEVEVDLFRLEEMVRNLYFGILLVDGQLDLHETLQKELKNQYDRVNNSIENGVATLNDLDEVRVEILKAEQQQNELSTIRETYLKTLSVYLGKSLGGEVTFQKPVRREKESEAIRPEISLVEAKKLSIEADWSRFKSELFPTIALFARGGYGKPGLDMFNPEWSTYFIGGVTFKWNFGKLYDIGTVKKSNSARYRLIDLSKDGLRRDLEADYIKKQGEVMKFQGLLDEDKEIVRVRKEIKNRAEIQVENGTLSTNELMQRINAYQLAEQTKLLHEIQLLKAFYDLDSANY